MGWLMAKTVRMADIAEKLGVSVVTVSKALSGKDGVGSELRSNIIRIAEEMGYCGRISKASASDSHLIGILNSYLYLQKGSSFYWSLYERLITHLSERGDLGVLEVVSDDDAKYLNPPRIVMNKKVDGIIAMGPFHEDYLKMLSSLNVPMVVLDSFNARHTYDSVISDGYYGMYTMTDYLISCGHRKIMFVGTVGETSSITDRYYGYCRAMLEAGINVTDDMVIPDRNDIGKIELRLPEDLKKRATALVCNCDFTAYEAQKQLDKMGISVPDDISIVGFDNYILSEVSNVKITTYEVNQDGMAKASVQQISERIADPFKPRDIRVVSGKTLLRDSVKKLNNVK